MKARARVVMARVTVAATSAAVFAGMYLGWVTGS